MGDVLERANNLFSRENLTQEQKDGVALFLEGLLHSSDNYEGYYHDTPNPPKNEEYNRTYLVNRKLKEDYNNCTTERVEKDGYR